MYNNSPKAKMKTSCYTNGSHAIHGFVDYHWKVYFGKSKTHNSKETTEITK